LYMSLWRLATPTPPVHVGAGLVERDFQPHLMVEAS